MANWCANRLAVSGPPEDIEAFRSRAQTIADGQPTELSFGAFVPAPDDEAARFERRGTRYEAEAARGDHSADEAAWSFLTAETPPVEWIEKVSAVYRRLAFDLVYAEPMSGFGGHVVMERGRPTLAEAWHGRRALREAEWLGCELAWIGF